MFQSGSTCVWFHVLLCLLQQHTHAHLSLKRWQMQPPKIGLQLEEHLNSC